jgi:hypothetical protein
LYERFHAPVVMANRGVKSSTIVQDRSAAVVQGACQLQSLVANRGALICGARDG